jgi:putative ABC transport system permease protein
MTDAFDKFSSIESYTVEDIKNFADSDYISSYYYTYSISLNGKSIDAVSTDFGDDDKGGFKGNGNDDNNMQSYDFTVTGYDSLNAMSEFISGTYQITEIQDDAWDIAFDGNYVFINEELATYNSLSLGDTIKLVDDDSNVYKFTIIGIYTENDSESQEMSMFSNSANTIITNANALISITDNNEDIVSNLSATFIINDYADADAIQSEFYEKGLDENYVVQTNEETATSGLTSIKNVKTFAKTFLIITLVIGGVVLFVINMINIRERKYEIGVLRTIGISKTKLTLQFLIELSLVAVVALIIGAGIGAIASKDVGNSLLASEISSSNEANDAINNNFGGMDMQQFGGDKQDNDSGESKEDNGGRFTKNGTPNVEAYTSINAVVNIKVVLQLLLISLALVIVSSISSMISIQRFSPLTILKERS